VIYSGSLHISRVRTYNGDIHWTYGFLCGDYQENVFITYKQNVSQAENMVLATCKNSIGSIRYGIISISDEENKANIGPILSSFKIFDDV
jgi:hypothetical protein